MEQGDLFIISAPSGTGKSTLCHRLMEETSNIRFSVSHTTRPPRKGELDGVDYHFITAAQFDSMVKQGEFLEWARVHGNCYGTSRASVLEILEKGTDVLLDIDVQGAMQLRKKIPQAAFVFVLPPSMKILEERLRRRGTDSEETIKLRLKNAHQELRALKEYDFLIINDDLIRAAGHLQSIVLARRCRTARMLEHACVSGILSE